MKKPKIWCDSITPKYNYLDKETNIRDYVNYCINRALAMFKYTGLPDTIPQTALEKFNIMRGFTIWAKVNGELYVFEGGLGGEPDVYGFPTIATVANPALKFSGNFSTEHSVDFFKGNAPLVQHIVHKRVKVAAIHFNFCCGQLFALHVEIAVKANFIIQASA